MVTNKSFACTCVYEREREKGSRCQFYLRSIESKLIEYFIDTGQFAPFCNIQQNAETP